MSSVQIAHNTVEELKSRSCATSAVVCVVDHQTNGNGDATTTAATTSETTCDRTIVIDQLHAMMFTILFLAVLCCTHTVFRLTDNAPFVIGSFHVVPAIVSSESVGQPDQQQQASSRLNPVLVEVYSHKIICWDAKNDKATQGQQVTTPLVTLSAGCQYTTTATSTTSQQTQSFATTIRATCFIRYTTVILAVWLGYYMLSFLSTLQNQHGGNKIIYRVATFSAFCALLAFAGNLKVLRNASQQAARLTVRHQDLNYSPEIARDPVSCTQLLVMMGTSEVPVVFSIVAYFMSILARRVAMQRIEGQEELSWLKSNMCEELTSCTSEGNFQRPNKSAVLTVVMLFVVCTWLLCPPLLCLLFS